MAEDRTLGVARIHEETAEEPSKQELQRRLDEARDSISHTVTEIKENVANQVQAMKETLDWREQFKKRPIVWSAGAMGVGFLVGYSLAAMVKGNGGYVPEMEQYGTEHKSYAAQPVLQASAAPTTPKAAHENGQHDEGPGLLKRLTSTQAYERVKQEAGNVGDALVHELTQTAKQVVLPALMTSLRNFLGDHLPAAKPNPTSKYQPTLEREPAH